MVLIAWAPPPRLIAVTVLLLLNVAVLPVPGTVAGSQLFRLPHRLFCGVLDQFCARATGAATARAEANETAVINRRERGNWAAGEGMSVPLEGVQNRGWEAGRSGVDPNRIEFLRQQSF